MFLRGDATEIAQKDSQLSPPILQTLPPVTYQLFEYALFGLISMAMMRLSSRCVDNPEKLIPSADTPPLLRFSGRV